MDLRMVRRLVGFYEYGNALDHLDQLTSMSDEEDFDAINEILADHREFDLFVKLPDGFRGSTSGDGVEDRQDNRRSGLEWISVGASRIRCDGIGLHQSPKSVPIGSA